MAGILFDLTSFDKEMGNPPLDKPYEPEELALIPDIKTHKVATMTIVVTLNTNIRIAQLFHLLPLVQGKTTEIGKSKKKLIFNRGVGAVGSVYSAKYERLLRGIDRTKCTKIFRHSISVEIESSKKIMNAKISKDTVHMCGASTYKDGEELAMYVINHIEYIESMLHMIQTNPEEAHRTAEYVLSITKGPRILRDKIEFVMDFAYKKETVQDYECLKPVKKKLPEGVNPQIYQFFMSYNDQDCPWYKQFRTKLKRIMSINSVLNLHPETLGITLINSSMVNINYKLDFKVNRYYLALLLHREDHLFTKFDNSCMQYVSIEVPCLVGGESADAHKTNYHSIMVHRSGSVKQSGRGGRPMEDAYLRFMRAVGKYKERLMTPEWTIFVNPESLSDIVYNYDQSTGSFYKSESTVCDEDDSEEEEIEDVLNDVGEEDSDNE